MSYFIQTEKLKEYRQPWETPTDWDLRSKFLYLYCNQYPEERLICLSHVFINIERLGCRYPAPIMREIAFLSRGLPDAYLQKKRKENEIKFWQAQRSTTKYSHKTQKKFIDFVRSNDEEGNQTYSFKNADLQVLANEAQNAYDSYASSHNQTSNTEEGRDNAFSETVNSGYWADSVASASAGGNEAYIQAMNGGYWADGTVATTGAVGNEAYIQAANAGYWQSGAAYIGNSSSSEVNYMYTQENGTTYAGDGTAYTEGRTAYSDSRTAYAEGGATYAESGTTYTERETAFEDHGKIFTDSGTFEESGKFTGGGTMFTASGTTCPESKIAYPESGSTYTNTMYSYVSSTPEAAYTNVTNGSWFQTTNSNSINKDNSSDSDSSDSPGTTTKYPNYDYSPSDLDLRFYEAGKSLKNLQINSKQVTNTNIEVCVINSGLIPRWQFNDPKQGKKNACVLWCSEIFVGRGKSQVKCCRQAYQVLTSPYLRVISTPKRVTLVGGIRPLLADGTMVKEITTTKKNRRRSQRSQASSASGPKPVPTPACDPIYLNWINKITNSVKENSQANAGLEDDTQVVDMMLESDASDEVEEELEEVEDLDTENIKNEEEEDFSELIVLDNLSNDSDGDELPNLMELSSDNNPDLESNKEVNPKLHNNKTTKKRSKSNGYSSSGSSPCRDQETSAENPNENSESNAVAKMENMFLSLQKEIKILKPLQSKSIILLELCCEKIGVNLTCEFKNVPNPHIREPALVNCELFCNGIFVSEAMAGKKERSKLQACREAISKLLKASLRVSRNIEKDCNELLASPIPISDNEIIPPITINNALSKFFVVEYADKLAPIKPVRVLQESARFSNVDIKFKCQKLTLEGNTVYRCSVLLGGDEVGRSTGPNQIDSKLNAANEALTILKDTKPILKIHMVNSSEIIDPRTDMEAGDKNKIHEFIPEDNVGSRLLRKMGWLGGGLGKQGGGIEEPIKMLTNLKQLGFMNDEGETEDTSKVPFFAKMKGIIKTFAETSYPEDLILPSNLNDQHKNTVFKIARQFNLINRSPPGKNELVIFGRNKKPVEFLLHLRKHGGKVGRYELIMPQQNSKPR